jgi:hypothetical protein
LIFFVYPDPRGSEENQFTPLGAGVNKLIFERFWGCLFLLTVIIFTNMKTRLLCILIIMNSIFTVNAQSKSGALKPERIFVHTDRNNYVAGENLFYTLYLQGNPGQMSKYAYLILRDKMNLHVADVRIEITNSSAFGNLYLSDTLNSGVYQLVCYTNCMRNYPEESFFRKEIVIVNRFDQTLEGFAEPGNSIQPPKAIEKDPLTPVAGVNILINPDRQVYNPRDKVSFSIQGPGLPENSSAHLSVSVSEVIPRFPVETDISEYFGNGRFNPQEKDQKKSVCKYLSENNGAVVQGRVRPLSGNAPQVDSTISNETSPEIGYTLLFSTPDSLVNMQFTRTDSSGSFKILLSSFYDGKELIVRLKDKANAKIETDNKFTLNSAFSPSNSFNVPGVKSFLMRSGKIAMVRRTYNDRLPVKTEKEFFPANKIPRLYYDNFTTIYPSDYVGLTDFVEITREILPALKIRKTGDIFLADYPALQYQSQVESEPTIFLDGVPIDDINQVITMGTDQIRRIDMLPEIRYYGEISFSGILAIFSNDQRIKSLHFKGPSLRMYALLSQPYTKPEPFFPASLSKHYPDLRQLLLWEPEIVLTKGAKPQIELYASDLEGKYRIDIQGITSEGIPVSGSAIITVQSKTN